MLISDLDTKSEDTQLGAAMNAIGHDPRFAQWGQNCWPQTGKDSYEDFDGFAKSVVRKSYSLKRVCDVFVALFILIVLSPLLAVIAMLIKFDSPGPIFFRHYRVGKKGELFLLWKFRSMITETSEYAVSPRSKVDARMTRVGRMLRRLSIDEIPQLINVLRGEMSLVGPRPEMPFIVAQYHQNAYERFSVLPGITGLWQISPARAYPIHENLQYDLHYVRNQNFWLDCVIIFRTIAAIIYGVGAV